MNAVPAIRTNGFICTMLAAFIGLSQSGCQKSTPAANGWKVSAGKSVALPAPQRTGGLPLNEALAQRRSHREFAATNLTDGQISQLCWAAQGISGESGKRTAPSAGALYPITLLLADNRGVREYLPESHVLVSHGENDVRKELQAAALNQSSVGSAPVCFIIAFDVNRTAKKYGQGAERYCLIETGHVAQNLLLEATSLELAAVPVGALDKNRVADILGLPERLEPTYLIPVGLPN